MKYLFLFLVNLFFSLVSFGQIIVSITTPESLIDTTVVTVRAPVTPGEYELTSVVATLANRSVNLINIGPYFQGNINTSGLTVGNTYVLTVTATDAMGNQGVATKNVLVDPPPKINIQFPVNHEVATPELHIKAAAIDNSDCRVVVTVDFGYPTYQIAMRDTFVNSVDTIIHLSDSSYQGLDADILFRVIDSKGQMLDSYRNINVESSPYLERIFSTEGVITDFNYGKVFSNFNSYPPDNSRSPNIADINTGVMSASPIDGKLTPTGVINGGVEWSNNTTYVFDPVGASNLSFRVAGVYAIWTTWTNQNRLYLRNTTTHSTSLLTSHAGVESFNVASNGTVAFASDSTGQYEVYSYANGTTVKISPNGGGGPATDGKNIVYGASSGIYLFNGVSTTQVSTTGNANSKVANGFVAFTKTGLSGQDQIWFRDTTGTTNQVTFYSTSSIIRGLGDDGSICFTRNLQNPLLYLYDKSSNRFKSIASKGYYNIFYRDSGWYVSVGRALFKLTPNFINKYYTVKSGSWSSPATWYGNVVPPAGADITVRHNLTADVNATCNTVTVNTGANLAVNAGIILTVTH